VITVASGPTPDEVVELARLAHEECYMARSLRSTVELEVTVVEA
jgi:organic hydroperoxide reductase OsmC/OhrA